ncbi:MAG: stage 0 sporulation family protein [Prolixibacteraceae bacterium]
MTIGNPIFRGVASSNLAGSCAKLEVFDWLKDVVNILNPAELVEIRFKNTRKDYFRNVNELNLSVGEMVAVEGNPGHDIGMVSLTGDLVLHQMKRHKVSLVNGEIRKVYRKVKPVDIEKWELAMQREHETMIKSRQIASELQLHMKIGDVEYQGDGTKAIFYYIADERVDFRQLIKVLAETFHIRIEMKQIGARQEAGRIGGIGPCGRELCCSSWMSNFSSVTTVAARYQDISLNPQKLAGQCSKLKCCLNYEVETYIDIQKRFPSKDKLSTEEGDYLFIKMDVLKKIYWYAYDGKGPGGLKAVPIDRVKSIQNLNRRDKKPAQLIEVSEEEADKIKNANDYGNVVGQDSLTRFDKPREANRKNRRNTRHKPRTENPIAQAVVQEKEKEKVKEPNKRQGNRTNSNRNRNQRHNDQRNRGPRNPSEAPKKTDQDS